MCCCFFLSVVYFPAERLVLGVSGVINASGRGYLFPGVSIDKSCICVFVCFFAFVFGVWLVLTRSVRKAPN